MKIEKRIPMPECKVDKGIAELVRSMGVGDSVFSDTASRRMYVHKLLKDVGFKGASRKEGNGFRTWRVV